MDVQDKVCLITGAATGIGAGVARVLLDKGAKHVAVLDINETEGDALEKELNTKHGDNKIKFIKGDVTKDLNAAFDVTIKKFGYIDVVINNAGIMNDHPTIYEKEIAVNVTDSSTMVLALYTANYGLYYIIMRAYMLKKRMVMTALITSSLKAYKLMRKDQGGKGGTIVNISSIVGLMQFYMLPIYSATKSAVLQFSNCLGKKENFERTDVSVITICFGKTDTNLIKDVGGIDEELQMQLKGALIEFPNQRIESAAQGLVTALERGTSGSTWIVTTNKPAEEITSNVDQAYKILGQHIF